MGIECNLNLHLGIHQQGHAFPLQIKVHNKGLRLAQWTVLVSTVLSPQASCSLLLTNWSLIGHSWAEAMRGPSWGRSLIGLNRFRDNERSTPCHCIPCGAWIRDQALTLLSN